MSLTIPPNLVPIKTLRLGAQPLAGFPIISTPEAAGNTRTPRPAFMGHQSIYFGARKTPSTGPVEDEGDSLSGDVQRIKDQILKVHNHLDAVSWDSIATDSRYSVKRPGDQSVINKDGGLVATAFDELLDEGSAVPFPNKDGRWLVLKPEANSAIVKGLAAASYQKGDAHWLMDYYTQLYCKTGQLDNAPLPSPAYFARLMAQPLQTSHRDLVKPVTAAMKKAVADGTHGATYDRKTELYAFAPGVLAEHRENLFLPLKVAQNFLNAPGVIEGQTFTFDRRHATPGTTAYFDLTTCWPEDEARTRLTKDVPMAQRVLKLCDFVAVNADNKSYTVTPHATEFHNHEVLSERLNPTDAVSPMMVLDAPENPVRGAWKLQHGVQITHGDPADPASVTGHSDILLGTHSPWFSGAIAPLMLEDRFRPKGPFDFHKILGDAVTDAAGDFPALKRRLSPGIPPRALSLRLAEFEAFVDDVMPLLEGKGWVVKTPATLLERGKQQQIVLKSATPVHGNNLGEYLRSDQPIEGLRANVAGLDIPFDKLLEIAAQKKPVLHHEGKLIRVNKTQLEDIVNLAKQFGKADKVRPVDIILGALTNTDVQVDIPGLTDLVRDLQGITRIKKQQPPPGFKNRDTVMRPYPHQRVGLAKILWMFERGLGVCLADDMGLGKGVQTLAVLQKLKNDDRRAQVANGGNPALVICPNVMRNQWIDETHRFTSLSTMGFRDVELGAGGTVSLKDLLPTDPNDDEAVQASQKKFNDITQKYDTVVATYEEIRMYNRLFAGRRWSTRVIDEAHNIKNPEAKRTEAVINIDPNAVNTPDKPKNVDYNIALTGTPIQNNIGEIWAIFRVINPWLLGNWDDFNRNYAIPIGNPSHPRHTDAKAELKKKIRPFIIRRKKDKLLPPKNIVVDPAKVAPRPNKEQAEETLRYYVEPTEVKTMDRQNLLNIITRLKQICDHPFLVPQETVQDVKTRVKLSDYDIHFTPLAGGTLPKTPQSSKPRKVLTPTPKMDLLFKQMQENERKGEKTLIFTQYAEMGQLIQKFLQQRFAEAGHAKQVGYMHGALDRHQRSVVLAGLQGDYDKPPVDEPQQLKALEEAKRKFPDGLDTMIMTYDLGVGINASKANNVVCFDPVWNPAKRNQAIDRTHRIGQDKTVNVFNYIMPGTIEERIQKIVDKKQALFDEMIESEDVDTTPDDDDAILKKLSVNELREVAEGALEDARRAQLS